MAGIVKQLLTGKDNETHDFARWATVLIVLTAIGLQIYHTVTTGEFDLQQFGIGMGTLLAGAGGAIKLKGDAEPS